MELFNNAREFQIHLASILFSRNDLVFIHAEIIAKISLGFFLAKIEQFTLLNRIAIKNLLIKIQCQSLIMRCLNQFIAVHVSC